MTLAERLRSIASALPSDASAVTFTRADLFALAEKETDEAPTASLRDLSVKGVAEQAGRAPSTERGWLTAGVLRGYKLNGHEIGGCPLLPSRTTLLRRRPSSTTGNTRQVRSTSPRGAESAENEAPAPRRLLAHRDPEEPKRKSGVSGWPHPETTTPPIRDRLLSDVAGSTC